MSGELKETPLREVHLELGAKMVGFAGWDMPIRYGSILEEHRAVREAAGAFDISHMGQFFVEGPEAAGWLNRLLTNNVDNLEDGEGQYTFLLNEKGGVIDDLILYRLQQESFLLVVNAAKVVEDFSWLKTHNRDGLVELQDRSDELAGIAVQGPHATLLETINAADTPADQARKLDVIDARVAIRNINDDGINAIARALPEDKGIEFWNEAMKRGYPRIFRRTAAQRVLESAAAITTYPEDTQLAIDQLLAEYYVELDDFNTRLLDKQRVFDPDRLRESIKNRQRKRDGEETVRLEDPTRELIAQRKAMGTRYIDRLRELLSPEEFDKLEGARRYAPPPASMTPKEAEQLQLNFNRNVNSTPQGKGNDPRTKPTAPGGKKPAEKGDRGRD